jgi:malate dehydrogenase (oxaloacetate-decarboxylating)(NADP+)
LHKSRRAAPLADQRFLFLGAGSAATGIAELISLAMAREGVDLAAARLRNALFDIDGLVVTSRTDLAAFQRPFAHLRRRRTTRRIAFACLHPSDRFHARHTRAKSYGPN